MQGGTTWVLQVKLIGSCRPSHDQARNEAVLVKALAELPCFTRSGEIRDLHCGW